MKKIVFLSLLIASLSSLAQRQTERLDRGVVAVNRGSNRLFVSWRFFATDPDSIGLNVYRQQSKSAPVKLNATPIVNATCWEGSISDMELPARYFVRPVYGAAEGDEDGSWSLPANPPAHRIVKEISYQPIPEETAEMKMEMKFCWPADLDGDGRR